MEQQFVNNLFDVKGKVAVITGATGALGKAVAFGYGLAGMKIFVTGRSDNKCKALCAEWKESGIECGYSVGDPAIEKDVIKVVNDAVKTFGEINVLVTSAGYNNPQPIVEQDLTEWMFDPESAVYKNFLKRLPVGRLGEPEDFVGPCIFLASSASDFMTGANIAVDGGYWAN